MSERQHTPGPWTADLGRWTPESEPFGFAIRVEGKLPAICSIGIAEQHTATLSWPKDAQPHPDAARYFSVEELKANAEFIVRACNSYDELLTALKYLTDAAEMDFCGGSTINCGDEESVAMGDGSAFTFGMIRKARAVIRKAESAT